MLTIEQVKNNGWLIFETVIGSKAYGLDTAASDTDIRGVFVLPKEIFYSLEYTPQVANQTNDIVYYELKRFIELLSKNNPNIIELLNVREQFVLYRHEIMRRITPEIFLSKLCEQTFANYAYTQIKKACGLEKKIVNPVEERRKSVLDFCYVYMGNHAIPLGIFLQDNSYKQEEMGLSVITHLRDCFNLYHSKELSYGGIVRKGNSNEVCLSSIPKTETPVALLYFNRDGYSTYCKRYKEYWEWVQKRNEARYNTTMSHGKNYDSKNMMHVFRLLFMAKEIAVEGKINVWRKDRDILLDIKHGKFEYDELVRRAETLKNELKELYEKSSLPEEPGWNEVNQLLIEMRATYYE
ncbi:MAG: DNA polymerase beta superfamily protein [Agriterribacter sp.]